MSRPNHRRVAGLFGKVRQAPFQPPRQRMQPENRAVEEREPLDERIVSARVLLLMGQHRIELRCGPALPALRQNQDRREPSHGDRRGASRAGAPSCVYHGLSAQSVRVHGANCQPNEQRKYAEQVRTEEYPQACRIADR
jgi:hypothetical protein